MQNKVNVIDEEGLARICITAFSSTEIQIAKDLLFDSVSTKKCKITGKKDGKKRYVT